MSTVMKPTIIFLSLVIVVQLTHCSHGEEPAEDEIALPFDLDLDGRRSITAVAYFHKGAPPWEDGNCVSYGKWHLLNMHAENLMAFKTESGARSLQVLPIDESHVLVIDDRVGLEWLRSTPCGASLKQRLELAVIYQDHFRTLPETRILAGTSWELINPPGMSVSDRPEVIEAILPGNRLLFREVTFLHASSADTDDVERAWLLEKTGEDTIRMTVYDMDDDSEEYSAISFYIERMDDELHLIPRSKIKGRELGGGSSESSERLNIQTQSYRLISRSHSIPVDDEKPQSGPVDDEKPQSGDEMLINGRTSIVPAILACLGAGVLAWYLHKRGTNKRRSQPL